jgi:hypothetical protein
VTRWLQLLLIVLSVGLVGFATGRKAGARSLELKQIDVAKKANAELIEVNKRARELSTREAAVALRESAIARQAYRTASSRVRVVTDSTVSIDNAPPVFVGVPVVSQLRSGSALAERDSVAMVKLQADVAACGKQNEAYLQRIQLLERQVQLTKPGWCGFKCGVGSTLGVLGLLALIL